MLEKLKSLSMGAKVGIASGAVLLAAAGVGLGITQPWNNQEETLTAIRRTRRRCSRRSRTSRRKSRMRD